jgi:drug/metabolite transporter (DMT)-like permease
LRSVWWIPPLLALFWGMNWPIVKIMLSGLPPFYMRGLAFSAAALVLAAVVLWQRTALLPPREDWLPLLASGLLNVVGFNLCTAFAQVHTTASRAAVLTYTMPLMAVLLAWLLLGEKLSRRGSGALVLGAAGIALLAWPALARAGQVGGGWGLFFPLLAAFFWALGTAVSKRWVVQSDPTRSLAWQLAMGGVAGFVGAAWAGEVLPTQVSTQVALAFVYHVLLATALAYLLWFKLLKTASAGVSSLTTLLVPVVGVLGAMALVGERPTAVDWLGFALVLCAAGVILLQPRPR